jgi:hypothetical protein
MGTPKKEACKLLQAKGEIWCGEGDLNPHGIAPASTSTYSSRPERHDFNHLASQSESDGVLWYGSVVTNTSHVQCVRGKRPVVAVTGLTFEWAPKGTAGSKMSPIQARPNRGES